MSEQLSDYLIDMSLFKAGEDGYHTYRIPSLITAANGDLLAFCEGRRDSSGDPGQIDLVQKQSTDNGVTWSDQKVVAQESGMTCGNPCPVVVGETGRILLLFCKNPAAGRLPRTVWITRSDDHGVSWSEAKEITASVMKNTMAWYATGPGQGIQLSGGRIIIPCDHTVDIWGEEEKRYFSHLIYSDDNGDTWQIGAITSLPGNECCAMELASGDLYLNARTKKEWGVRSWAISRDNGLSFIEEGWHRELVEPKAWQGGCQGSMIRFDAGNVLFCNPASDTEIRRNITLRISRDDCRTWSEGTVLWEKLGAYSDMCLDRDGNICVLHEAGDTEFYSERLRFVKLSSKQAGV